MKGEPAAQAVSGLLKTICLLSITGGIITEIGIKIKAGSVSDLSGRADPPMLMQMKITEVAYEGCCVFNG